MKKALTIRHGRARIGWVTTKKGTVANASVGKIRVEVKSKTLPPDVVVKKAYAQLLGRLATKQGLYCEALELELSLKDELCINHKENCDSS